jgi:hypothetical protein
VPFWRLEDERDPRVVLEQVGPNAFQLLEGFRYRVPEPGGAEYVVHAHDPDRSPDEPNNSTDLASVPFWLWWFVASYGTHTRAALLHDELVEGKPLAGSAPLVERDEADRVFRLALEESKVRWMRRWLMWTSVSLATMAVERRVRFALFVAMLAALVALVAAWPLGRLGDLPGPGWALPLAVFVAGLAWGRRWPLTVLGLVLVAGPTLLVWATLLAVWVLDLAKAVWSKLRGRSFEAPPLLPYRDARRRF